MILSLSIILHSVSVDFSKAARRSMTGLSVPSPNIWDDLNPDSDRSKANSVTPAALAARCDGAFERYGLNVGSTLGGGVYGSVVKVQTGDGHHLALKRVSLSRQKGGRGFVTVSSFAFEVQFQEKAFRVGAAVKVLDAWICADGGFGKLKGNPAVTDTGFLLMPLLPSEGRLDNFIQKNKTFDNQPITPADEPAMCTGHFMLDGPYKRLLYLSGQLAQRDVQQMIHVIQNANKVGAMITDFHPHNAYVDADGKFKLIDFGRPSVKTMGCCVVDNAVRGLLKCDKAGWPRLTEDSYKAIITGMSSGKDSDCPPASIDPSCKGTTEHAVVSMLKKAGSCLTPPCFAGLAKYS